MAIVAELLCGEPAVFPLSDHLRAAVCYFNTSLPFNLTLPLSLSEFITPVAQLDLWGKSHNNVSPQTSNSVSAIVLIRWRSDSSGRREIKTAVTQMNWTRRTIRMKNKKLFCSFVTCSNCCDTEKTQSATWSDCKRMGRAGFRKLTMWLKKKKKNWTTIDRGVLKMI